MSENVGRRPVIGTSGPLGSGIQELVRGRCVVPGAYNPDVDGATMWKLNSVDVGSKGDINKLFDKIKPGMVIITIAMTNVDAREKNPALANRVSAAAPGLAARAHAADRLRERFDCAVGLREMSV